jgi:transposase InsO family protein
MVAFIDQHKDEYGVEPMCSVLPIAPSTYYEHARRRREPKRMPARHQRDGELQSEIRRVYEDNQLVYGAKKVWRQLWREDVRVARCTVARFMAKMGLRGAVRGRAFKVTTVANDPQPRPLTALGVASKPSAPISSRSRTSPTSRPGAASSTSRSLSMSSRAISLAGACRRRCGATWRSTRWASAVGSPAWRRAGPSQRPRSPIPVDSLQRATR